MTAEKLSTEDRKKAKEFWDCYRQMGIEPSVEIYDGFDFSDPEGEIVYGETLVDQAYIEFEGRWICPYCGRHSDMGEGSRGAYHLYYRFKTVFNDPGKLRAHIAVFHPDVGRVQFDRTKNEYWDDVRTLLDEGQISHDIWTRELKTLWRAVRDIQAQLEGKKKGV